MTKAFNNRLAAVGGTGNKSKHTQIQKPLYLDKIHLDNDEFTTHSGIKQISKEFVQSAMDLENFYQGGKKKLIVAFAYDLEVELKRLGQDQLISKISTFIMKLLKQARIKWSPIYLRRCLDNRYKEPINQANALARKQHPGLPEDSGRTVTQLEQDLKRTKGWGEEYAIKRSVQFVISFKSLKEAQKLRSGLIDLWKWNLNKDQKSGTLTLTLPTIITARPREQMADVEVDMIGLNNIIMKPKPKPKPKSKPKAIHDKELNNTLAAMAESISEVFKEKPHSDSDSDSDSGPQSTESKSESEQSS